MSEAFNHSYVLQDGSTLTVTGVITAGPVVPPVDPPDATPNLVTIGGSSRPLTGTNVERVTNALVRYIRPPDITTTNQWGVEVAVNSLGTVTAVNDRQASQSLIGTVVPIDGYVLSGHDQGADWLRSYAKVNASVTLSTSTVMPPVDPRVDPPATDESKTLAVYQMMWPGSGKTITTVPAQCNEIRLAFAQGSQPALVGWANDGQAAFVAAAAAFRARGGRVVVSIGGEGGYVSTANHTSFLAGIANIRSQMGGNLDGIDWDIEASSMNPADVVAINLALKAAYGPLFRVSFAPNGSNIDQYLRAAVACQRAGCLDSFGQQFYDSEVPVSDALWRVRQAIDAGIPANKITIGMMIAPDARHWTVQQCSDNYKRLLTAVPGLNGAYLWESSRPGTAQWANDVGALVFA